MEDRPAKIKAQLFPYDDDITIPTIVGWIDQLDAESCVLRYEVDGRRFLWVRNLKIYQHFHRDEQGSKLPEPPQDIKIHRASTVQAPHLHAGYLVSGIGNRESGNGDRGNGNAQGGALPRAPRKRRMSQQTGCPAVFEISDSLRDWASRECPNVDLKVETDKFLDYHRAKGNSFKDWDAAWRTWVRNSIMFSSKAAGRQVTQSRFDLHERNKEVLQRFVARGSDEKERED